jgi:hypothetical protein
MLIMAVVLSASALASDALPALLEAWVHAPEVPNPLGTLVATTDSCRTLAPARKLLAGPNHDRLAQANRFLVSQCASKVPVGTARRVKVGGHGYSLERTPSGIRVGVKIVFKMPNPKLDPAEFERRALRTALVCREPVQAFYRSYGIDLDLSLTSGKTSPTRDPDSEVTLEYRSTGRADASRYFTSGQGLCRYWKLKGEACRRLEQQELCLTMAHEIGHTLSLPDEYEDRKSDPRRKLAPKDDPVMSLMSNDLQGLTSDYVTRYMNPEGAWWFPAIYPRHAGKILAPMCGD